MYWDNLLICIVRVLNSRWKDKNHLSSETRHKTCRHGNSRLTFHPSGHLLFQNDCFFYDRGRYLVYLLGMSSFERGVAGKRRNTAVQTQAAELSLIQHYYLVLTGSTSTSIKPTLICIMTSSMLEKDIDELHRRSSDVLLSSSAATSTSTTQHAKGGDVEMSRIHSDHGEQAPSQPLESSMNESNTMGGGEGVQDANSDWVASNAAPQQNLYEKHNHISRREICICVIAVIAMIVATSIGLAVAVKNHNETSKANSALPEELEGRVKFDPVTKEWVSSYQLPTRPVPTPISDQDELNMIIEALRSHPLLLLKVSEIPDSVAKLASLVTTDPYALGAQWLTNTDTYNGMEHTINRYALAVMYYSLSGDKWYNRTNWLSPTEYYCHWHGVVCCNDQVRTSTLCHHHEFGKIIEIDLFRNNLIGTIPDVIALFNPSLYSLYVSENSITGTIPGAAMATLSQFGTLNAAYNFLTGTIPVELNTNEKFSTFIFR